MNALPRDRPETDPADRRVRRTRDAVRRALMALMLEKGYEAVTVADIIERADIGRSTFYTHFADKQHVLYAGLDELAGFLRAQRDANPGRLFGFSLALFTHVHEQRPLLRVLFGRRGGTVVQQRIRQLLTELVREDLEERRAAAGGRPAAVPLDLLADAVAGAHLALLARWADTDEPAGPKTLDHVFRRLVVPGVEAALAS
jgi:AcrR family transcriptional regulator